MIRRRGCFQHTSAANSLASFCFHALLGYLCTKQAAVRISGTAAKNGTTAMKKGMKLCLCALATVCLSVVYGLSDGRKAIVADSQETAGEGANAAPGYEIPATRQGSGEQILYREGYTVSYNRATRLPNWVAWHLTADHVDGPYKRKGVAFQEDTEVETPRATTADYTSSGYDRGHMCPSGDCKWSEKAQQESFLLTNVCPQVHGLNAGDWNEMEAQCRRWAKEYGNLYIVCGPILYGKSRHKTIGRNKVTVPEAFFKVVLRTGKDTAAIGFIYKNAPGNRPKGDYANTVDEVERITGYDFFPTLPDDTERKVESEADTDAWF